MLLITYKLEINENNYLKKSLYIYIPKLYLVNQIRYVINNYIYIIYLYKYFLVPHQIE